MIIRFPASELETYIGFTDEAREHLDQAEQRMLALTEGGSPDDVNALFRALHTIKGVASFLGLEDIQKLSHMLETVFDSVRQGNLDADKDLLRICLTGLDRLSHMIANLRSGLEARAQEPDSGFAVDMEAVEYRDDYEDIRRLQAGIKGPGAEVGGSEELVTPEMAQAFVKEAVELLDATEQIFLRLDREPGDMEALVQAFRNIHSFKGNCGFFGYADLEKVSHRLESLLEAVREGGAPCPPAVQDAALKCLDLFRLAVGRLAEGGTAAVPEADIWTDALETMTAQGVSPAMAGIRPFAAAAGGAERPKLGDILVDQNQATREDIEYALALQKRPLGEILVDEGLAPARAVSAALSRQGGKAPIGAAAALPPREAKRDLRVDLAKLDQLLDLVGELVISTGMIFNHPLLRECGAPDLERISHQLKSVVGDLQNVALGVRMIPVEGPFRKMTRLVHDLSSKSGKKVRLEFRGEETEIDKNVADLVADPLVHMIRNSVDHGLEQAEERIAAGKDPCGVITLEAGQDGGDVLIVIRDDGRGMSRAKILAKARERGLVDGDGAELTDSAVFQFIFMPGFSTAESVTATSGRGVGMDVVKSNIEKLNGRISIDSAEGRGSVITLRLPLTLSIIDGMLVRVGGSLFTLPLSAVRESIAPAPGSIFNLGGAQEMLMLRGKALPIVRLHRLQGIAGSLREISQGLLICLESRGAAYCLFVDDLLGQRQTVVKALPAYLGKIPGVSSCSILDNGEISLILDVPVLFHLHVSRQCGPDEAAGGALRKVREEVSHAG